MYACVYAQICIRILTNERTKTEVKVRLVSQLNSIIIMEVRGTSNGIIISARWMCMYVCLCVRVFVCVCVCVISEITMLILTYKVSC